MVNNNILSERYTTGEINSIFSEFGKNVFERELWIAVMKSQKELGINIPSESIEKFENSKLNIDLNRIKEIEKIRKHDVKAKIEHFVEVSNAGEYIHLGMTSRDLTDNVEQMQIKKASQIIFGKYISVLKHMLEKAELYSDIFLTARTHHQAAQPTLLGKRFSTLAEELTIHLESFENLIENYPLRGIKGPTGTQFDMLSIFNRDEEKVKTLENRIAEHLGFKKVLISTGQVYPRSLDLAITSSLSLLTSACENLGINMRLMAGYDLVTEGFKEGQVGSSIMPHKMNTPHSERICGLSELVKMYAEGSSRISGNQWEEGDVSCSAPRRVIIPDIFYASDGVCETSLDVLKSMGVYPVIINNETDRYLPFLATTEILSIAVKSGMGREKAHKIIKKYSIEEALRMRSGRIPNLAKNLSLDPSFLEAGITEEKINNLLQEKNHFIGRARKQIEEVKEKAKYLLEKYSIEANYTGKSIL